MGTKRRAQPRRRPRRGSSSGDSCASSASFSSLDESCASMASFDSVPALPPSTSFEVSRSSVSKHGGSDGDMSDVSNDDDDDDTSTPNRSKQRRRRGKKRSTTTTTSPATTRSTSTQSSKSLEVASNQDAAVALEAERQRLQSRLPTPKAPPVTTTQQRKREAEPPGQLTKKGSKLGLDLLAEAELRALEEDSSGYSSSIDNISDDQRQSSNNNNKKNRPEPPGIMEKKASKLGLDLLTEEDLRSMDEDSHGDEESSMGSDDESNSSSSNNTGNNRTMEQLQREYQDNMSVVSDDLLYMTTDDERSVDKAGFGMSVCSLDFMKELDDESNKEQRHRRHKMTTRPIPHTMSAQNQQTNFPERAPLRQDSQKTKQQRKRKLWGQMLCFAVLLIGVVVVVVGITTRKSNPKVPLCGDNEDNNGTEHENSSNCTTTVETEMVSVSMPLDLWGILDNMLGVTVQVFVRSCSEYWTVALAADPEYTDIIQQVECRVLSQELVVKNLRRQRLLRQRRKLQDDGGSFLRLKTVLQVLVEVRVVVPKVVLPFGNFTLPLLQDIVSESGGRWQNILSTASEFFASLTLIAPPIESTESTNTTGGDELGTAIATNASATTPNNSTESTITTNLTLAFNGQ